MAASRSSAPYPVRSCAPSCSVRRRWASAAPNSSSGRGENGTSNVAPTLVADIVRRFQTGDHRGALEVHQSLLPLFDALFCETNPIPVKCALHLMGLCGPEIRLPLTPLTDANRERLQVVLKELELA